jgi:ribosomal protein S27E
VKSECPRCEAALTTFALSDVTAVTCEACGYVGVDADHTGEAATAESWAEALQRFHDES